MKLLIFVSLCFSLDALASLDKVYVVSQNNKIPNTIKDKFANQTIQNISLLQNKTAHPEECSYCSSHKTAWKDTVKNGYQTVIIVEDHIKFQEKFNQNLNKIIKNIPNDSDVFFLDIGLDKPSVKKTYFVEPEFWLKNFSNTESPYYAKIKKSKKLWGLHAYCISAQSAKKLLQLTESVSNSLDTAIIDKSNELNLYVSKIKLVSGNYDKLTKAHKHLGN